MFNKREYADGVRYLRLLDSYINGELSANQLKQQYFIAFKSEANGMSRQIFIILEDFFEDLDAFSPLWTKQDESPIRLTEDTLWVEAKKAQEQLRTYLAEISTV